MGDGLNDPCIPALAPPVAHKPKPSQVPAPSFDFSFYPRSLASDSQPISPSLLVGCYRGRYPVSWDRHPAIQRLDRTQVRVGEGGERERK